VHQVLQCLGNLWFSTQTQGCDWPEKSDCNCYFFRFALLIVNLYEIGKAGHLYTSSTAATNMIDGDGNLVTTPRNSRPTNIYLPIECPPGVQGHFPDPYDCSAFHYCNGQFDHEQLIETNHCCDILMS
jgi:hypothetical protein